MLQHTTPKAEEKMFKACFISGGFLVSAQIQFWSVLRVSGSSVLFPRMCRKKLLKARKVIA